MARHGQQGVQFIGADKDEAMSGIETKQEGVSGHLALPAELCLTGRTSTSSYARREL